MLRHSTAYLTGAVGFDPQMNAFLHTQPGALPQILNVSHEIAGDALESEVSVYACVNTYRQAGFLDERIAEIGPVGDRFDALDIEFVH